MVVNMAWASYRDGELNSTGSISTVFLAGTTALRCCFATWFASHLFLHIKDRLALVRPRAVVFVTPYSVSRWSD